MFGAQVEDIEGRGEQQRELQGRANRCERVGERVVGREDGDVEGVVLELALCQLDYCVNREVTDKRRRNKLTFRPITPRQAMDGMAVAMSVSLPAALFLELAKLAVVLESMLFVQTGTSTH